MLGGLSDITGNRHVRGNSNERDPLGFPELKVRRDIVDEEADNGGKKRCNPTVGGCIFLTKVPMVLKIGV